MSPQSHHLSEPAALRSPGEHPQPGSARIKPGHLLCILIALLACDAGPGAPHVNEISVSVTDPDGGHQSLACVQLPLLLGSQTGREVNVDNLFRVSILARRDWARIQIKGAKQPIEREILQTELDVGYAEQITVQTIPGRLYQVFLASNCSSGN